jgi:parallel beta-helix repeat protein
MTSFWPRVNTLLLLLLTLMAASIIAMLATRAVGGPLDPPGPPATGTDGVRGPGTPISSLPFAIDEPGYYYVTRDLTAGAGQSGITISVSNVTVDLGGFTLTGAGVGMSPGDGISNPGARNIVIRNGAVRGWNDGIDLGGQYSRVERIQALSNLDDGIQVGAHSEISDCNASLNGSTGITASYATVRNCTVAENYDGIAVGDNSLVEGNRVNSNTQWGIDITGSRNMILDNQLSGNIFFDVTIEGGATYNVVTGNVYCTAQDAGAFTSAGIGNWC